MNKKIYIMFAVVCLVLTDAFAQQTLSSLAGNSIKLDNLRVEHTENSLLVKMNLDLDSLEMPSNMRFVFTPMVKYGEKHVLLPQIVLNGRKQDLSYRRWGYKKFSSDVVALRRKNDTRQTLNYSATLPFEAWMKNCNIEIAEDLCGCGGEVLDQNLVVVHKIRTPYLPYVRPKAEARKERQEEGRAFVDFPVDKITLYPDYRNNPQELNKIIQTINLVKNDRNTTITGIRIHGFASPESPYEHNAWLAENRARTLKDYVCRLLQLEDRIFTVSSTPEDWDGLRKYVESGNLEHRSEILALIDDRTLEPDAKEWRIKQTYPEDYRFMLEHWYPALRHSDYVVTYCVRPFSVEEAKLLLKTKPQQLSLEEMFLVAQTYQPGSQEFNEVMEIAVRMFPDDEVANINAACARMESGDLEGARQYLEKAGRSADALHVKGVLAILEGNVRQARQLLEEARNGGAQRVEENLLLLE